MALLLVACATTVPSGHLKEDESLDSVTIGKTTRDEVSHALGSPSSESTFGPATWYYVSSMHENRSVMATRIIEQHVIEITFDTGGIVNNIKQYTLEDGKNVDIATNSTPTEGQKLGFFEQILSNLGRFNKNKDATGNSHTHGNPTGGQYPTAR